MADDFVNLDATDQAALVANGQVTPSELVEAAIARIERVNPIINAVITPTFDGARAAAAASSTAPGPFAGVPFLLKDLMVTTAGDRYCAGMAGLKALDYRAPHDSELAARFRRSGLIFLGKTNSSEWGSLPTTEPLAFGATRNPWNINHSPSGSSGGSAAAVASAMVAVASGGDGGGSIRTPASACGVFGLKPSRGRIPGGPDHGEVWAGFASEGVLSRSVRDTAAVLDAISGPAVGDPNVAPAPARPFLAEVGADPGRLRIGLMVQAPGALCEVDAGCVTAVENAGRLLDSLGHYVDRAYPAALDEAAVMRRHFGVVVSAHSAADFEAWERLLGRPLTEADIEPVNWAMVKRAQSRSTGRYLESIEWIDGWRRRVCAWWSDFDVLVTPTMAVTPLVLGELMHTAEDPLAGMAKAQSSIAFTAPFNASGQPAASVPLHWTAEGLPVGVQFVAAPWRENVLLRLAAQLESAQPWAHRHPPIWAGNPA